MASRSRPSYRPKPLDEIQRNMSAIRSKGNVAETALRMRVHGLGLRFRKYPKTVFGRPDFVFPSEKLAVFVDGDFWHGRTLIDEGPAALRRRVRNREYWISKLRSRVERDRAVTRVLENDGWTVLRFWESDVKQDMDGVAQQIAEAVHRRRSR